jgi:hypothetical protein
MSEGVFCFVILEEISFFSDKEARLSLKPTVLNAMVVSIEGG